LASAYDGRDRWALEALGIGADGDWDACLEAWSAGPAKVKDKAARDIVWRSRGSRTPEDLALLLLSPRTPENEIPRYLRDFDFQSGPAKQAVLMRLAFGEARRNSAEDETIRGEALSRLDRDEVLKDPAHAAALKAFIDANRHEARFLDLIERFRLPGYSADLVALARANAENSLAVRAVRLLLDMGDSSSLAAALSNSDPKAVEETIAALGTAEDPRAAKLLWSIVDDPHRPLDVRRQAIRAVGRTRRGAEEVLSRAEHGRLEASLREAGSAAVYASASDPIRARAAKVFPLPPTGDARPLPPVRQLLRSRGDVRKGEIVFATVGTCAKCHVVNGQGKDVGPNLSEIGAKLSRPAIYESILFPSAAISHNFAAYTVVLTNGNVATGILISRTPDSIAIKGSDAVTRTYRASEVEEIKEQTVSLMPADLQKAMTADDLVNLVEYLTTLKPHAQKAVSARVNAHNEKHE
jgi:putative heme-binding domain-containing protein